MPQLPFSKAECSLRSPWACRKKDCLSSPSNARACQAFKFLNPRFGLSRYHINRALARAWGIRIQEPVRLQGARSLICALLDRVVYTPPSPGEEDFSPLVRHIFRGRRFLTTCQAYLQGKKISHHLSGISSQSRLQHLYCEQVLQCTMPGESAIPIDDALAFELKLDGITFTSFSHDLDKAGLIACHNAAADEAKKLMRRSRTPDFSYRLLSRDRQTASLSSLTPMFLWESSEGMFRLASTDLDRVLYNGRVLYGRFCAKPFMTAGVHTVLEDISGSGVLLVIDNAVCTTVSEKDLWRKYPDGMAVAIKEPLFTQLWNDGTIGLKVTNPADIVPLQDRFLCLRAMEYVKCGWNDLMPHSAEALVARGHTHFDQKEWSRAAICCTTSAEVLESYKQRLQADVNATTGTSTAARAMAINDVNLTKIYGKISDVYLQLGRYKKALDNAEKALQLSPNHVDSLLRRARSLKGMRQYDDAIGCLQVVQASTVRPHFELKAQAAAQQGQRGIYQLQTADLIEGINDASEFETYVGPVEIRMDSENGRRGMYATRDVNPGELLLVSKPLARGTARQTGPKLEFLCQSGDPKPGPQEILCKLSEEKYNATVEMIAKAQESPQYAKQVNSLQHGFVAKEDLPPMSLFTEDWDDDKYGDVSTPENQELHVMSVDTAGIRAALLTNAFVENRDSAPAYLYGLPSFFNHSCAPNCFQHSLGDLQFMSSSRSVAAGEMLTISYFPHFTNFNYRKQASMEHLGQKCDCVRCIAEDRAITEIPALEALVTRYCTDFALPKFTLQVIRAPEYKGKCFQVKFELERILNGQKCRQFTVEQKDWIRSSFAQVYVLPLLSYPRYFDKDYLDEAVRVLSSVVPGSTSILGFLAIMHAFLNRVDPEDHIRQYFLRACEDLYLPVEKDFANLIHWAHQRQYSALFLRDLVTPFKSSS